MTTYTSAYFKLHNATIQDFTKLILRLKKLLYSSEPEKLRVLNTIREFAAPAPTSLR